MVTPPLNANRRCDHAMKKVHSEIYYTREAGVNVHSDQCGAIGCNFENIDDEFRKYLHDSLDEWLNKSNGTGIFYIKEEGYKDYDF